MINDVTDIQNAVEEIQRQQRELAVSAEQQRVARDLHDNIGQVLSFMSVQIQTIKRELKRGNAELAETHLGKLKAATDTAHTDLREYVFNLRSPHVRGVSFGELLEKLLRKDLRDESVRFIVELDPSAEKLLDSAEKKTHLISLTREAVNNSLKHSGAARIRIGASLNPGGYEYYIEDDGRGLPRVDAAVARGTSGMKIMEERALLTGGRLIVSSSPGKGTRISVHYEAKEA